MTRFFWILGDSRKIPSCWVSFYVLLLSIHTKEKGILSHEDLAINMKYWRRQKVRISEEWLLLAMRDMLSHWDLMWILEFQSLGKILRGLNYCFSDFPYRCDTILSWSTQRMNYLLFFSDFILHSGSKGDQGVGRVCGGHSSYLNRSENKEIIH